MSKKITVEQRALAIAIKRRSMDKWSAEGVVHNMTYEQVDELIKLDKGLYVKIGSDLVKKVDIEVHRTLTYRVWDIESDSYDGDIVVDQDGTLFICHNGWGCEGGGGREEVDNRSGRYVVHIACR